MIWQKKKLLKKISLLGFHCIKVCYLNLKLQLCQEWAEKPQSNRQITSIQQPFSLDYGLAFSQSCCVCYFCIWAMGPLVKNRLQETIFGKLFNEILNSDFLPEIRLEEADKIYIFEFFFFFLWKMVSRWFELGVKLYVLLFVWWFYIVLAKYGQLKQKLMNYKIRLYFREFLLNLNNKKLCCFNSFIKSFRKLRKSLKGLSQLQ